MPSRFTRLEFSRLRQSLLSSQMTRSRSARSPVLQTDFAGSTGGSGMTARDDLIRVVHEYEALLAHSAGLNAEVPDHRKEAIQVRRWISEKLAAIASTGNVFFAGGPQGVIFNGHFSKMRSTMSYHQASWPVVSVNYKDANYRASEAKARKSSQEFIAWVNNVLEVSK